MEGERKQFFAFETLDELKASVNEQVGAVTDVNLQHSTRLYLYTRYFVVVFESRYGAIPIQVWNEYRNALDHFFRFQLDGGASEAQDHMQKMDGHLQRAALDILKIFCHNAPLFVLCGDSERSM